MRIIYEKHWASPTRIITTRKIQILPQWIMVVIKKIKSFIG